MERIVRTICQGCHPECGVLVHVDDGVITKIEGDPNHPISRGFICIKGREYSKLVYHRDRIRYPLKRSGQKGEGKWQRVSWDEALTEIAGKFTGIREKYGPEANAVINGTGPRASGPASRLLAKMLGTPNRISVDLHICMVPATVAETFTVGQSITLEQGPDYLTSKCILVWGGNPLVSHPPRGIDILEATQKNQAKLIVVDPRRTQLASRADLWLQIRPGADGALALAFINVIINEKLYDAAFVEKWCHGFDKLAERVQEYSPEKMAEITWISADEIKAAARLYATTKPAALHQRVGVNQNVGSTQTSRALIALVALTGNIDIPGGNLFQTKIEGYIPDSPFDLETKVLDKRIGSKEFPLISGRSAPMPFVHAGLAIEAMLTGKPYPIKGAYCAGANPVMVMQNSKKVWEALKQLELFVVADFFITPTAELADYILPAATWLERDEYCDRMYNNCVGVRQKAINPRFNCRDDMDIVIELVRRLPGADRKFMPWNSVEERNDYRVKGMGLTFAKLNEQGYLVVPPKYKKYENRGFRTPTGKVELYSSTFEKYGYDPLPVYTEPPESPISTPELRKEYPHILITGARLVEYYHSTGHQISALRERKPDPEIEIHPSTALEGNLHEGDWVWVETPKVKGERVKFKVKITTVVHPKVVHTVHAWWYPEKPAPEHGCFESNINVVLSADQPREPICGSTPLRGTLCKVYK